jgi:hypothetical protein
MYKSQEMPAECNTSGTLALVLPLDVKFVNTSQIITQYFHANRLVHISETHIELIIIELSSPGKFAIYFS